MLLVAGHERKDKRMVGRARCRRRSNPTYASMMAWIWRGLPAVTLEMVQQASFLIPSLGDESKANKAGRAPAAMMTWVCKSSPVTMLPTDRRAGV